ncbi:MAG: FAD-dependent oxidoreductase [Prosthecobacter sp.]|uniref:FAD-dependent oxidoreductase n=1 Tax=Prosthecobacter sp. TaxID=1965333 RepID=UPI0038FD4763
MKHTLTLLTLALSLVGPLAALHAAEKTAKQPNVAESLPAEDKKLAPDWVASPVAVSSAMEGPKTASPGLHYYYPLPPENPAKTLKVDVCVYGGTPAGVTAAVQAGRMGKNTILAVFRRHVGGMTSGGLTAIDIGNRVSVGGLAGEIFCNFSKLTGFSSGAAEKYFRGQLDQAGAQVLFEHRLKDESAKMISDLEPGGHCWAAINTGGQGEGSSAL